MNRFVPVNVTYADAVKSVERSLSRHRQNSIVIFGDIITCKIRVTEFNREFDTGHAKIKTFPGAHSKEFPHYITSTLEGYFDVANLHFGVSDLLQNITRPKAMKLILNLKKRATKSMSFGVSMPIGVDKVKYELQNHL